VRAELAPALERFNAAHWEVAMGSSGTAGAAATVLRHHRITDGAVTPAGLRWLIEQCVEAGHVDQLDIAGLKDKRRAVFPGGLSILYTVMVHCGIRRLQTTRGALRQGVIIDLHEHQQQQQQFHDAVQRDAPSALQF
jgi:exopolyphosphatase/guanosine-5'-triphosphate,3'-diphosphate pyrophosphatase